MQDIRKSPEYQRWRREVKHRDENTCRVCTVQRNLHVHHIKPLEKYLEFATDLDNGITLCGNCHAFLSGREENTNLQTITEAFTGQQDMQTAEQLKRLNGKFSAYLEDLLKSEDQDPVDDAIHKMFVHLQTYPDSLDQFLHLIEYILSSEKGFGDRFVRKIAIEAVKNHSNKTASEILSKYETSWNYQDGKRAYLQGDYAIALRKFEPLAESGHTESQHYLGVIYEEGRGVPKDAKAAIKWYLRASQQGNMDAHTRLEQLYRNRRVTPEQDITDQHRSDFDKIRRQLFLAKQIARLQAKPNRTSVENIQLSALQATQRTHAQQEIYESLLNRFMDQQIARLQAKPELSATETRVLDALTAVQSHGIPEEAFEQKTPLTRQSFFQRLSSRGIELCLCILETCDVKIEIKDNKFTMLDIERSSGTPVSGSSGVSGSLNAILNEKVELETESDPSEAYSQLNGEVFLTQADIPMLRASLAGIKDELDELLRESRLCECANCQITRDELDELLRESGWTHEDDEEVQKLDFTKQIEKLNEHPINHRAREILEELAPTYYEVNQGLRDKIIESERETNANYGISPWWGLDVIILLEWAETYRPLHLENELRTLWTSKTEAGSEKLYDTLPMMSDMSYHLSWLVEPLWEPDQQPKDVLDKLCGKHLPICQELEQTRENFRALYGEDNAVRLSQGGLSADIAAFLTEPDPKTAINKLKELLRVCKYFVEVTHARNRHRNRSLRRGEVPSPAFRHNSMPARTGKPRPYA